MIKIGITGSYGKTSVCEILYQYLLNKGKSVGMYSTNGFFKNGSTIQKDYLNTTYPLPMLSKVFEDNADCDYLIIELKGENAYIYPQLVNDIEFDIVGLTNYDNLLYNHFKSEENYLKAKKDTLKMGRIRIIPNDLTEVFNDVDAITYTKEDYSSNLISDYHKSNLSLAIKILSELDIHYHPYNNFVIRGRFELFRPNIILDTGWVGVQYLVTEVKRIYPDKKIKVIFSIYKELNETEHLISARRRIGLGLEISEKVYLLPTKKFYDAGENDFALYKNQFSNKNNVVYCQTKEAAFAQAIAELQSDEILLICTREDYRFWRNYIESLDSL